MKCKLFSGLGIVGVWAWHLDLRSGGTLGRPGCDDENEKKNPPWTDLQFINSTSAVALHLGAKLAAARTWMDPE